MTDEELRKIAEARRWANGHHNRRSGEMVGELVDALEAATRVPVQGESNVCLDHKPVQHRDGKPPWCNTCGRASVPDAATEAGRWYQLYEKGVEERVELRAERDAAVAAIERARAVLSNDELVWSDGSYTNVLVVEVKDVLAALVGAPEPEVKP